MCNYFLVLTYFLGLTRLIYDGFGLPKISGTRSITVSAYSKPNYEAGLDDRFCKRTRASTNHFS